MKGKYSALTVAKWFLWYNDKILEEEDADLISNLKLQKLLYLAQGYSYAFYDRPLFKDDLEGWVHGPVVRNVYDIFKNYQYNSIDTNFEVEELDDEAKDIINYVIKNFGKYDAKYLEKISHEQEPWILSRRGLDPDERSDKTISKESIANYFINEIFQPEMEAWD